MHFIFQVRVLYVRNLTQDCSEEKLKETFEQHGKIERVKKIKDYAFIHFEDRDCAVKVMKQGLLCKHFFFCFSLRFTNGVIFFLPLQAMRELNGKEMGGSHMEVSLAKPPSDKKKKEEMLRARERRMMQMMQMMQTRGGYDNALYETFVTFYILFFVLLEICFFILKFLARFIIFSFENFINV